MTTETDVTARPNRRKVLAGLGVAAVAIPACSTGTGSVNQTGGDVSDAYFAARSRVPGSILPELTPKAQMELAPTREVHTSYAPEVPPAIDRADQRIVGVDLQVLEGVCPLDPENDVSTLMWGYRVAGDDVTCGSPGPILRGRVGDVARISLENLEGNQHPHNIDFHAVTGQGGGAADLTVAPGETASIEVRLLYPGAFMYHCAFGDVPEHIAKGMVGMFIVDPEVPLAPVDHEWAVMQSEWYVGEPGANGEAQFDRAALELEEPRYVTFNGRTDALSGDNALAMEVGERARIYMVNEGINLDSNFHPIGSHWDVVYPEAATHHDNLVIRGSQSTLVVAGGGTVTELLGLVPSTVILVDHALVRTFYKGCIGQIVISGDPDPELFEAGQSAAGVAPEESEAEQRGPNEVSIPVGAFDPDFDEPYSPRELAVAVGTTVTWTNDDSVVHTVTSGEVAGNVGEPDGIFDSGNMAKGDTFSYTFDTAGEFPYHCTPHPWMTGTVVAS